MALISNKTVNNGGRIENCGKSVAIWQTCYGPDERWLFRMWYFTSSTYEEKHWMLRPVGIHGLEIWLSLTTTQLTSLGATQWPILDVFFLPCDLKYCYWDVTVSDKYLLLKLQWKLGVPRDSHFLSLDSRNFCEREQIQSARTAFFLFPLMCSWHWVWMKASPDYELKKQKRRAKESQRS